MSVIKSSTLAQNVAHCFILAYTEDTRPIQNGLAEEGFAATVLRPTYTDAELKYSRTIRCLLNHRAAWRRASDEIGLSLIVEADFVPCLGFAELPLPFNRTTQGPNAWAFLYAGGPRIFKEHPDGTIQGHASCPVAYVVSPEVARKLCEYAEAELKRHGDLSLYSLWDTQFQWHLMGMGVKCFMPYRQYGEHGGLSNPEHAKSNVGFAKRLTLLGRLGFGQNHRAETLYRPLRFLPLYAKGSRLRFWRTRIEAKITGFLKLIIGRVVSRLEPRSLIQTARLYWIGIKRLCTPW